MFECIVDCSRHFILAEHIPVAVAGGCKVEPGVWRASVWPALLRVAKPSNDGAGVKLVRGPTEMLSG